MTPVDHQIEERCDERPKKNGKRHDAVMVHPNLVASGSSNSSRSETNGEVCSDIFVVWQHFSRMERVRLQTAWRSAKPRKARVCECAGDGGVRFCDLIADCSSRCAVLLLLLRLLV